MPAMSPPAWGQMTLKKLGMVYINLQPCPFQFNLTGTKLGPRFFGLDGTGSYFGLTGYYRSIPSWRPFITDYGAGLGTTPGQYGNMFDQFYGFTLNASGIFDVQKTRSNPFQLHSQIYDMAPQGYQAPYIPYSKSGSDSYFDWSPQGGGICQGFDRLLTTSCVNSGGSGQSPAYGLTIVQQELRFNPLSFETVSSPPACSITLIDGPDTTMNGTYCMPYPPNAAVIWTPSAGIPYLIYDDLFVGHLVDKSECGFYACQWVLHADQDSPNPGWSNYRSHSDDAYVLRAHMIYNQIIKGLRYKVPIVLSVGGAGSYGTSLLSAKVDPSTGNCLLIGRLNGFAPSPGQNTLYGGNILADSPYLYPSVTLPNAGWFNRIYLSDPNDQTKIDGPSGLLTNANVQQIPDGGWLVGPFNDDTNTGLLIAPDFSGYFGVVMGGITWSIYPEEYGMSWDGHFFMMNWTGSLYARTYHNLYSTLNGQITVQFYEPLPLHVAAASCRLFNRCLTSFEG